MKPFKNNTAFEGVTQSEHVKLNVFAEPSARKSYQRLFEIAKLNLQTINTATPITKLLWQS